MADRPGPARRICLLRLSALGDVCNCIGLVRELQQARPRAQITWVIGRTEYGLVEDLPEVEFVVVDKRAGLAGFAAFRKQIRNRRFDVLLHAQVSARANALALLVRARRRIGFDRVRSREGHGMVVNERIAAVPFQHQAEAFLEFARALGIEPDTVNRAPPIPESAREFARQHLPAPDRAVLISPCSSHPRRNWSARGYAAVADWVLANTDRSVVLMGGPSDLERQTGAAIERAMKGRANNLIGQDTLKQALAVLQRGACLIAPDSGPAHLAAALGTPVVGLYAATWSRRSGPLGSLEHCVDRFPEAARKYRRREPEQLRWGTRIEQPGVMELIEPEAVIEKLEGVLAGPADAASQS